MSVRSDSLQPREQAVAVTSSRDREVDSREVGGTSLTTMQLIAYSAPVCAMIFLWNPTVSILPGMYAKYFGLSLIAVAQVLLITRVVDAIADPIAGYLSDRHRVAGGSRKAWMVVGGIGLCCSAYFLFSPPVPASQTYYLIWSLAFYLAWTLIDIPHIAWGAELVGDYDGRARIYGYRGIAIYLGLVAFCALPFLPMFASSAYTPETLRGAVFVGAGFMFVALAVSARFTPNGTIPTTQAQDGLGDILASILRNKPLLHFLATYFSFSLSLGMWSGFIFIYLDSYLNLNSKTSVIFLAFSFAALLSVPGWVRSVSRSSKSAVLAFGIALYSVSLFSYLFITPESEWWVALVASCGVYIGVAAFALVTPALLADVVDYGMLKFDKNRGSTYFAFLTLSFKASSGFGAGLVLGLTGYFGFDATAAAQSQSAILGLRMAFIAVPLLLALIAFILAVRTPITKRRHEIIRRRIGCRESLRAKARTLDWVG